MWKQGRHACKPCFEAGFASIWVRLSLITKQNPEYTHVSIYMHMHTCIYIDAYTYMIIYIYIHTYIHIHAHISWFPLGSPNPPTLQGQQSLLALSTIFGQVIRVAKVLLAGRGLAGPKSQTKGHGSDHGLLDWVDRSWEPMFPPQAGSSSGSFVSFQRGPEEVLKLWTSGPEKTRVSK